MAHKPLHRTGLDHSVTSFPTPCPLSTASLLFLKHKCMFLLPGLCIYYSLCLTCTRPKSLCDPSLHSLQFSAEGHLIQKAFPAQSISNRTSFTSCPLIYLQFYWQPSSLSNIIIFTPVYFLSLSQRKLHEGRDLALPAHRSMLAL